MERSRQDLVLGLVFFGSLALLMAATVVLTGLSFGAEPQERRVLFSNAAGLREGDSVFVLGHRMGSVTAIGLNPDARTAQERVVAELRLDEPVLLTDDYQVRIEQGSLLGGMQIALDPGDGGEVVPVEVPLRGRVRPSALEAVGDLFSDDALGDDLRAILDGIRTAVERMNAGESTIGKLFGEATLYEEVLGAVRSARRSLETIESGEGAIGMLIHDPAVAGDLAATVGHARSVAAKIDGTEGLLGRVIGDPQLANDASRTIENVAAITTDLREGRGALGALLADADVADDVRRVTGGFAELADNLNDPKQGLIGELVAGTETRDSFVRFVSDLADISASIRDGRGLAGRLIYDEELGEQFSRMLLQVARAIEDAREAAPIGSFFQVISGAF